MKYFNLSPSTDINKPAYFEALNEKLNDPQVKNIAVIGPYGSGKSSVIDSFFNNNEKFNYLHISLANFCENSQSKNLEKQPNSSGNSKQQSQSNNSENIDEQKIEEQILQQLFYQLDNKKIPFSGFKKIEQIDKKEQRKKLLYIIAWFFTLIFIPGAIVSLIENLQEITERGLIEFLNLIYLPTTLFNIAMLGAFGWGLFYFMRKIHEIFQKGLIKKITMKSAMVELKEVSGLNKHIDEIIYFFEATDKNILVIEDLDRFNSTELFSKLREVNFIINNSPKIKDKKVVKFIYAIKDDVFTKNLNRTKFFDFILPVVPVINVTNSGDQLREMIGDEKILGSSYINDISLYIHDMRLLKNIANEFKLFSEILNEDNKKRRTTLFSVVLYKNLFPEEYCKEHAGEGLLKKVFTERKNEILQDVLKSHNDKLKKLVAERDSISEETAKNEESLRGEYVLEILKYNPRVYEICNETVDKIIKQESAFEKLFDNATLSTYRPNQIYRSQKINFVDIQKKVNSKTTYNERLKLIKLRNKGRLEELISEINKTEMTVSVIKRKKLAGLVKLYKGNNLKAKIFEKTNGSLSPEQDLLILLLRKGYINESYPIYISYFYEGALTLKDFEFLLNVKNNEGDNFHSKLSKTDELISRIDEDEYEYKSTLNKDLIIALLNKSDYKTEAGLELLLRQLQKLENVFKRIVVPIIIQLKDSQKTLQRFLELLVVKYFPAIWNALEKQNFDEETNEKYLKMFLFLSEENIQTLNNSSEDESFRKYMAAKSNFVEMFISDPEKENAIKIIKSLDLKFHNLALKRHESHSVFNYISQNNHYELNPKMLYLMLFNKHTLKENEFEEFFNTKNYTCLFEADSEMIFNYVNENIEAYIDNIYLHLESDQEESEDALLTFLENVDEQVNDELLPKILGKVSTKIDNLESFGRDDLWHLFLENDCIYPSWNNLIYCYEYFDNELNAGIVDWLNFETVFKNITKKRLRVDNFTDEKEEVVFLLMNQILECDSLSDEAYERIIQSFPYTFPKVNLVDALSRGKISFLLNYRKITFNVAHYHQLIKLGFIDELKKFAINNISSYLDDYSNYAYSHELNTGLLRSNLLSIGFKRKLVKIVPTEEISDAIISDLICNVLLRTKALIVDNNKFIKVIKYCSKQKKQIQLLDKYLMRFSFTEITEILRSIGGDYKKASALRARPSWENNKLNTSLANKLNRNGFFSKIEFVENEIKIVVRYPKTG